MKTTNFFTAVGFSMLFFSIPVFAGNGNMADSKLLAASLAKASSPENVKAVALQQKKMYCNQNAKNKKLQGGKKEDYLTTCMNKNEALLAFATMNSQRLASSDINEMMQQSPTITGSAY